MSSRNSKRLRKTRFPSESVRRPIKRAQLAVLVLCSLHLTSLIGTANAQKLTDEEIFEKAFKKKATPEKPVQIPIPVYYENNRTPVGHVQAQMGPIPQEILLEADPVMRILEGLVEAPLVYRPVEIQGTELVEKESAKNWVPLTSFKNLPYQLVYDEKKLEIRILVPPEARKKGILSVSQGSAVEPNGVKIEPATFSSYLNILGSQAYQYGSSFFQAPSPPRQPLRAAFQHGAHYKGYVLESNLDYYEPMFEYSAIPTWRRGDVKLTRDFQKSLLRGTIGDLTYKVRGFQTFRPMGGVNFSSFFAMDTSKLTIATGQYEIFLKRPSKVEVWVNQELRQTFDLPAGPHDLRNFPFVDGANDLKLGITDDLGQHEELDFTYFSSAELLNPGLNEVSYSVGAPWTSSGSGRSYDTSRLTSSIIHRRGMSETLTLGANLQADPDYVLLGGEAVFPVWNGLINIEPAISKGADFGLAVRTRYIHMDRNAKKGGRSFAVSLETRSPRFSLTPEPLELLVPVAHAVSASTGWSIAENTTGSLGFGYKIVRKSHVFPEDTWSVTVGMSRQWKNGPTGSLSLREQKLSDGRLEVSLAVGFSMSFRKERQRISGSYSLRDDATRLEWSYTSPQSGVGSTRARAAVRRTNDSRGFESNLDYVANRATLGFSHFSRRQDLPADQGGNYNLTQFNLQAGTALVFADGQFAISRPVTDSFVIVAPGKNLSGKTIQLNPKKRSPGRKLALDAPPDSFEAETGILGAAAITEMPSYSPFVLKIAPENEKETTGIPTDLYLLKPRYRTGFVIPLGTDLNLHVSGKFVFQDGTPLGLLPGRVRSSSDLNWPQASFFTSKSGKTRIEGFKPGRYVLEFHDAELLPVEFEIPESSAEIYDLGQVVIRRKQ